MTSAIPHLRVVRGEHHHRMDGDVDMAGYQEWMRGAGLSPSTVRMRADAARRLTAAVSDPASATAADLRRWLSDPSWAPWTRCTYFAAAKSLYAWLVERGEIPVSPMERMKAPQTPHGVPRPLSDDEVARALDAARGRTRDWLLLGLLQGLRVHEAVKLRGEDATERTLYVLGKGGKPAYLPTHPDVWSMAARYPRDGWWFPSRAACGHVSPVTATAAVTGLFRPLGIEGSLHRARHTYGTRLLRAGVNIRIVQELMRHESLATTARYTAVGEDERTAAIRALRAA